MTKLRDICRFQSGGTPSRGTPAYFNGNVPWITTVALNGDVIDGNQAIEWITDEAIAKSAAKIVPPHSVMVGTRVGIGKVAINSVPMSTSQDIISLIGIDENKWDKKFICHLITANKEHLTSQARGATIKGIKIEAIADLVLPEISLKEQARISEVIGKVDALMHMHQQMAMNLEQLIKSRFIELFGDPVINPKGFPCYTVGEVIDFQGGSQPDKKYFEYEASPDNIRLIQIRDYKSDKYITYIPKTMAKRFCTADDIMIGRYGPPIFQILKGIEGSFNVALMKATPKIGNKEFVRQFLKQDCLLEYLEGLSKRTAGQDGIQMDKLKAYPFPYPPIELQEQFAAFVEQTDKSKLAVQKGLQELEILKKSLMQQYFG